MIRNAEENEIESRQIIDGVEFKIPLKGVWVTVIDYTLSRCEKGKNQFSFQVFVNSETKHFGIFLFCTNRWRACICRNG